MLTREHAHVFSCTHQMFIARAHTIILWACKDFRVVVVFLSANATLVASKKERKLFATEVRQIKMYSLKSCHFYFYNRDFKAALQYRCKFCCKAAVASIAIIQLHLVQFSSIPMCSAFSSCSSEENIVVIQLKFSSIKVLMLSSFIYLI